MVPSETALESIRQRILVAFRELDSVNAKYDWLRWFLDSPKKRPVRTPRVWHELAFFLSRVLGSSQLDLLDDWYRDQSQKTARHAWWFGVLNATNRYTQQELRAVLYG